MKKKPLNISSDARNQDAETIIRRFSMQLKQASMSMRLNITIKLIIYVL